MDNQQSGSEDFVICPYCGEKLRDLYAHIRCKHHKTKKEALQDFPGMEFRCKSLKDKVQKINKRITNTPEVQEKRCKSLKVRYETDEDLRNKISSLSKDMWKREGHRELVSRKVKEKRSTSLSKEKTRKANKIKWSNKEYHDRVSSKIRKTQNKPEKRQYMSKVSSENIIKGKIGSKRFKVHINGRVRCLRSKLEYKTYEYLNSLNIYYEYENIKLPYISYDGSEKTYVIDYYIPKYNLILEVKPSYKMTRKSWIKKNIEESTNIQLKKEASLKSGYKYIFVTEDDLVDINSFKKCLDFGSTTNLDIGVNLK